MVRPRVDAALLHTADTSQDLAACLRRAGAVTLERNGRPMPAYFSSVSAEVAVCLTSVGLAVRIDLEALEVSGHSPSVERLITSQSGQAPPADGHADRVGDVTCGRLEGGRTILIGGAEATARWRHAAEEMTTVGFAANDAGNRIVLSVIGPRLDELLSRAVLTRDLPPGSARECRLDDGSVVVLRESPYHAIAVVESALAARMWRLLFEAGRTLAIAPVGADAVARLRAVRRLALG